MLGLLLLALLAFSGVAASKLVEGQQELGRRLGILYDFAKHSGIAKHSNRTCSEDRFLEIDGPPFGQTNNNLVTLKNALWFGEATNRTLLMPQWLSYVVVPFFSLNLLHSLFCFEEYDAHNIHTHRKHKQRKQQQQRQQQQETGMLSNNNILVVNARFLYFGETFYQYNETAEERAQIVDFDALRSEAFGDGLLNKNDWNEAFLSELQQHSLVFSAALWSSPKAEMQEQLLLLVSRHLRSFGQKQQQQVVSPPFFGYAAVQKRSLDGGCNEYMERSFAPPADFFSPIELPIATHAEWQPNARKEVHPLCTMSANHSLDVCARNNQSCFPLYVLWDGQGSVDDYRVLSSAGKKTQASVAAPFVVNADVFRSKLIQETRSEEQKQHRNRRRLFYHKRMRQHRHINEQGLLLTYVDMMAAMHANFFIMNPISSMTWSIFVVRSILALPSVPDVRKVSELGIIYLWLNPTPQALADRAWKGFRSRFATASTSFSSTRGGEGGDLVVVDSSSNNNNNDKVIGQSERCARGPYIFYEGCRKHDEGVGSAINRMKLQIVLAKVYNLTVIPNPACFTSSEHFTDLVSVFAWGSDDPSCRASDVEVLHGKVQEISKGTMNYIKRVPVYFNDSHVPYYLYKGAYNGELLSVCSAISKGEDFKSRATVFSTNKKTTIWKLFRQVEHLSSPSTAFLLDGTYLTYWLEGFDCTRTFIRDHYEQERLSSRRQSTSFDNAKINLAIHFRHGDVAFSLASQGGIDHPNQRALPMKHVLTLLHNLLNGSQSILHAPFVENMVTINFFSEGNLSDFVSIAEAYPSTRFFLGNAKTVVSDLDHMSAADVFVASPSSFSSLIAALNIRGITLTPNSFREKFEGIDNVARQELVKQNYLKEFNDEFCLRVEKGQAICKAHKLAAASAASSLNNTRDAQLVRCNKEIFLVTEGQRRSVPNMQVFASLKTDLANVIVVPCDALEKIPVGPPLV